MKNKRGRKIERQSPYRPRQRIYLRRKTQRLGPLGIVGFFFFLSLIIYQMNSSSSVPSSNVLSSGKTNHSSFRKLKITGKEKFSKVAFAEVEEVKLHLPFPKEKLTALAYHQASNYPRALPLKPHGKESKGSLTYHLMWRTRRKGPPNRAADIGSKVGTMVYSPVLGRVTKIKKYNLYQKSEDYEIHILPRASWNKEVVMIHLTDIQVKVGDEVRVAQTPIGKIRNLAKYFPQQLSEYSGDEGNHVHIQVNTLKKDGKEQK